MEEHLHDESKHGRRENLRAENLSTDVETPSFRNTGDVVGAVFRLYRDNFLSIIKIIAVLTIPLIVVQHLLLNSLAYPYGDIFNGLSAAVAEPLLSAALIYAVMNFLRAGAFPALGDSYRWGFKRWGKVFLCSVLFKIITVIGFALLIVPGVIFSLMYALVIPIAVIERTPAKQTFDRSSDLTKNYRWQIFVTYFLFSLVIIVVALATTFSLGGGSGMESSLPFALAQGLITQSLESSSTVLTLFIYLGILRDTGQPPSPPVRDDAFGAPLRDD